ncbi:CRISPR-associated protein [Corynebacterium renale]|uniref:type I-E CRISPR-associated protein Cse1/CasA n=1 Tax=Corynebacterium renale TaxID=1724 RepID=UPI000DA388F1|nr:type I-E CRISPR-associated protein Cse1/CasA [Corynebacterium renale]SQG63717.1 CRISPR-associated protein [Corynebacterium renale]STD01754.1 CRISPR-associated protein [Corynebacterium renale]
MSFNLIEEPWIICETAQGTKDIGIKSIFDGSEKVLRVVGDSPTQDYVVLRTLLAIFWRAQHQSLEGSFTNPRAYGPFEWSSWFIEKRKALLTEGRDEAVLSYLEKYRDRFDLLDHEAPFMQVADLHTKNGNTLEVSRIIPEAEHDYFTMRTGTGRASLSFAEAARWLIHAQAYDYSGIKPGVEGDPRVKGGKGYPIGTGWTGMTGGTFVRGENLLDTLLLNTTLEAIGPDAANDLPVWERKPDSSAQRVLNEADVNAAMTPEGASDLATWQSRRIRLFTEEGEVVAVLVGNGDRIPDAGKNVFGDVMTPYRFSPNQTKKGILAYYPQTYSVERTMWNSLDALLVSQMDSGFSEKLHPPKRPQTLENLSSEALVGYVDEVLDVSIVSMEYGPQSSSVGTIVSSQLGIPLHLLRSAKHSEESRQKVRNAAQTVRDAATALGSFVGQLSLAAGGDYAFNVDAADRLYTDLEPKFIAWLRGLTPENIDDECVRWESTIRRAVLEMAREHVRGAGPKALIGRLDGGEDGTGRIVNAGSLHNQLLRKLRDILPLLTNQRKKIKNEEGGTSDE